MNRRQLAGEEDHGGYGFHIRSMALGSARSGRLAGKDTLCLLPCIVLEAQHIITLCWESTPRYILLHVLDL
jgi:hypothetical protein